MTAAEWKKKKEEEKRAKLTAYEQMLAGVADKGSMTAAEWKQIKAVKGRSPFAPTNINAPTNTDVWFKKGEGNVATNVAGTAGDVGLHILKGAGRLVEGVADLGAQAAAGAGYLFGNDDLYQLGMGLGEFNLTDMWTEDAVKKVDRYSVLGDKSDAVAEGVGQAAAIVLTGGAAGAIGTTALTGLSTMGTNIGKAHSEGATGGQAFVYGLTTGAIEAGVELLSGGLGKGVKALGISKGIGGIDDILAKNLSNAVTKTISKESC